MIKKSLTKMFVPTILLMLVLMYLKDLGLDYTKKMILTVIVLLLIIFISYLVKGR